VAYRVLDLLDPAIGAVFLRAPQLTPELSIEIARARNVIFIDADVNGGAPHIEPIVQRELRGSPLAHAMTPAEVVCLAARLFGFDGAAFVCHVPGIDFDPGEGLSAEAEANAHRATHIIAGLLGNRIADPAEPRARQAVHRMATKILG
jgi:Ni,Fe-hydrogenase maturation factor